MLKTLNQRLIRAVVSLETAAEAAPRPVKVASGLLPVVLGGLGLAQANNSSGIGNQIQNTIVNEICPLIKFLAGTGAWVAIAAALIFGAVMLAVGGRNGTRYLIVSVVAAVLLGVGKTYISGLAQKQGGNISQCL